MTVFIFEDELKFKLSATIRVEVYSREVIYTRIKLNTTSSHTLALPAKDSRTVRLHTNKPFIHIKSEVDRPKRTIPGDITYFSVKMEITDAKQLYGPTIVNCVDVNRDELMYSWLFIIEAL